MTSADFRALLERLADGWRTRAYASVAAHFAADVHYGDPQRYMLSGRDALLEFFAADDGREQQITWHLVLFDEAQQIGVAEYTYEGTHRYHGVALARVRDGLITHWREYQHISGVTWAEFTAATAFPQQT